MLSCFTGMSNDMDNINYIFKHWCHPLTIYIISNYMGDLSKISVWGCACFELHHFREFEYSLYLEFYYLSPPKNYPKSWKVNNTVFSRQVPLALFPYRSEHKILCPHSFLPGPASSVPRQSLVAEQPVWFNIVLSISETPTFNFQSRETLSFHVSVEVLYFKTFSLTDLTQDKKAPQFLCHSPQLSYIVHL